MKPRSKGYTGESQKSYRTILEQQISKGLAELERPTSGLFISGLSAGLELGFSLFLMAVTLTLVEGLLPKLIVRILVANAYSVGFIFVILGRSELFTEHTTLAVLPVLNRRASLSSLGRLWGLVYTSNIIGGAAFAVLAAVIGPSLGVIDPREFGQIARDLVMHPWWVILLSAMLAGWMMGLLSWLVTAGRDTISQIFFVWLVTVGIGFGHLHHSIAGTVEVLAGVFSGQGVGFLGFGHFLFWTTLGNAVGGVFFVALFKYSHAIRGRESEKVDTDNLTTFKQKRPRQR